MPQATLSSIIFDPLLPLWLLGLLIIPIILAGVINRRIGRTLLGFVVLLVLANPIAENKVMQAEKDIVLVVRDNSPSNSIPPRLPITDAVSKSIKQQLAGFTNIEPIFLTTSGSAAQGSNLFSQIKNRLDSLPLDRLSSIIAITDGELTELPNKESLKVPLHVLHTSPASIFDRRLIVHQAPSFALLGKPQTLIVEVQDNRNEYAPISLKIGNTETKHLIPTNSQQSLQITLDHAGTTALQLATPVIMDELTDRNNTATQLINGVRENLNVLLVSGLPHNGARVIRNLLKSDPSVHLVHFTILRTLGKIDPTPDTDLALIPFPVDDLFTQQLKKFDLIIFDRYIRRGFIDDNHFNNIINHVRGGKALLVLAGPDYSGGRGLSSTPLNGIMPVTPISGELTHLYRPHLSNVGKRHPITAPFVNQEDTWGRFSSLIPSQRRNGHTLMTAQGGAPLLATTEEQKGRVGIWLSSNWWFWSRGIDGGGPQVEVLRRLTHWLMRQPELEEKRLDVRVLGDKLNISYTQVDEINKISVEIISPEGIATTHTITKEDGFKLETPATEDGLYTIRAENGVTAYGVRGQVRDLEWRGGDTIPLLESLAKQTNGIFMSVAENNIPKLRQVHSNAKTFGPGWVGLPHKDSATLEGITQQPLLPFWLGLMLILATIVLTWWLEMVTLKKKR